MKAKLPPPMGPSFGPPTTGQIQMPLQLPWYMPMMAMKPQHMISPFNADPLKEEKRRQFARSVYVSGFEKTVTSTMLEKHFSKVKTVHGIKVPTTKFNESKGFAFIYFYSGDDAALVKRKLDRSIILRSKIRVTKTVVAENLSKMIFRMKTKDLSDDQIEATQKSFFNDESLEKEVESIIQPIFGTSVEINKIVIPITKDQKKPLTYARVFFYISNLREAAGTVRRITGSTEPFDQQKGEYEIVLSYIVELLNKQESFNKLATAELYEYTNKNQSNVLHLKGISHNKDESLTALAQELKEWIQKQDLQWKVENCYAALVAGKGAWANVTFATYDDTKKAYEHLKNVRPIFRDTAIYGSMRNIKDLRTVVFSVVKNDVEDKTVRKFLEDLAVSSPVVIPAEGNQTPTRKYQFFSYNILEQKSFYLSNESNQVGVTLDDKVQASWRPNNKVPRRLVIHFYNYIDTHDAKILLNDMKANLRYTDIFMTDDNNTQLKANHQGGHTKNDLYVKHAEMIRTRVKRIINMQPRLPRDYIQMQNRPNREQIFPPIRPLGLKIDYKSFKFSENPMVKADQDPIKNYRQAFQNSRLIMNNPQRGMTQLPMMGEQIPIMGRQIPMMARQIPQMVQIQMMGPIPQIIRASTKPIQNKNQVKYFQQKKYEAPKNSVNRNKLQSQQQKPYNQKKPKKYKSKY